MNYLNNYFLVLIFENQIVHLQFARTFTQNSLGSNVETGKENCHFVVWRKTGERNMYGVLHMNVLNMNEFHLIGQETESFKKVDVST